VNSLSDKSLINRVLLKNDKNAFAQLVRKYQSDIRNLLYKVTNGNQSEADDIAQETFIRAYLYLKNFNSDSKLSTWLYRIALNVFKTKRKQNKYIEYVDKIDTTIEPKVIFDLNPILEKIDIEKAILSLSDIEKTVVILFYDKDMTHSEIAECLNCPLGTIKTLIAKSKKKIKKQLTLYGYKEKI
jgi:RNA polymerase sigma factor (sigma-70 family)